MNLKQNRINYNFNQNYLKNLANKQKKGGSIISLFKDLQDLVLAHHYRLSYQKLVSKNEVD